ncbi:MAG: GNAT family protein [bacterium]|nr:GNAT family protein [bacterium]
MMEIFDFSIFPVLETERLRLRQITHEDAPAILALYSNPAVIAYLDINPPIDTTARAIETIDWMNSWYQQGQAVRWAITRKGEDRLLGTVGFHFWERQHRRCDIGYDLLEHEWGKGYATEAAQAVVRWCFLNLNLHRVQADLTEGNLGSEGVLLKIGFKFEGVWRENTFEHGRFVNLRQFGLLRREYLGEEENN